MPAPHSPVVRGWRSVLAPAFACVIAFTFGTLPPLLRAAPPSDPKPDPLAFLAKGETVEDGKVRLSLALLRVPAVDFARALKEDSEAGAMSWQRWLTASKRDGLLEEVAHLQTEAAPGESFKAGYQRRSRYIRQGESSHYWNWLQRWTEPGLPPKMWNELLGELAEEPLGTVATGQMALSTDHGAAELSLEFAHTHGVTERPAEVWAHSFFPTPRMLYRPWEARTKALVPLREPFLIAAQMEPPDDGQAQTGYVLALFGRVTLSQPLAIKELNALPLEATGGAAQLWTLSIPADRFATWVAKRSSPAKDDEALTDWLAGTRREPGKNPAHELLAVTALAISPGKTHLPFAENSVRVSSELKWHDPTGFEPPGSDKIFRPLASDESQYTLRYSLELNAVAEPALPGVPSTRVHAVMGIDAPAGPLRWKKWKHAMEGRENDAGNLELAEASYHGRMDRCLETPLTWQPGRTLLTSATLQGDRAHVTFTRMMDGTPTDPTATVATPLPVPNTDNPVPGAMGLTVWRIDTPSNWTHRLLGKSSDAPGQLANDLLTAVKEGKAKLVTLTHRAGLSTESSSWVAARPVTFYGGNYVNTAPHPKGIYFNMRDLGLKLTGEDEQIAARLEAQSGLALASLGLESSALPSWRHWGIWQPGVQGTNAENSGINRPVFPTVLARTAVRGRLADTLVAAVCSDSDRLGEGGGSPVLHWWLTRVTWDDAQPPPSALPMEPIGHGPDYLPLQCLVVPVPKDVTVPAPAESQALADSLLAECAKGTRRVLDVAHLFSAPTSDTYGTTNSGVEYHFTNGRPTYKGHPEDAVIKAPATLPPGSTFSSQIEFGHRLVGMVFEVQSRRWKVTRDHAPPEVITDTFHDAMYEFPMTLAQTQAVTSVSVQRPLFHVASAEGLLPPPGRAVVTRLTDDTVVIVRWGE